MATDEETELKSLSNPFVDMGYVSALSPCKGGSFGALDEPGTWPVTSGITNTFNTSRELNINEVLTVENKMKCPSELIPDPGASDTCELRFFGAVGRTAGIVAKPTFLSAKRRIYVQGAPPDSPEWVDVGGQETSYSSDAPGAVILKAPRIMEKSVTFRLPATDGVSGDTLVTDGQGNLSFGSGYWTKLGDDVWYKPGDVYVANDLFLKKKTAGSVLFIDPGGLLGEDNSNFYYDSATKALGLGTNALTNFNLKALGTKDLYLYTEENATNYAFLRINSGIGAVVNHYPVVSAFITEDGSGDTFECAMEVGATQTLLALTNYTDDNRSAMSLYPATGVDIMAAGLDIYLYRQDSISGGTTLTSLKLTGTAIDLTGTVNILLGNELRFQNPAGTFSAGFEAPALLANVTWVLPTAAAGAKKHLLSSAADALGWGQNVDTDGSPSFVRATMSQTTGTSPLAITSTTVCTNLNADLLDGYHAVSFLTSVTAHDILSATHGDTTAAAVSRGSIITGQGVSPKWAELTVGAVGTVLTSDGTDVAWGAAASGSGDSMSKAVVQAGHGLSVGNAVKCSGANTYAKAQADSAANAEVVGIVASSSGVDDFVLLMGGYWASASVPAQAAGTVMYLDPTTAGALTVTEPTTDGQISKPVGVIVENGAKMLIFNWRGVELATLAVTGADLGTTFGATATNLHNTIITTFTNRAYAFQNLATCASAAAMFTGLINTGGTGGLTATNVPYDGDSNEAMLVPFPTLTLDARIVLHNTTRGTARLVTAIDTTNNFITTVSTADAWADNDALTMESQTCSGGGSRFCDLDLSGMIPATATAVYLEVNVLDSAGGGGLFRLHPYGAYSASKIQHTYGQVANISNMGHCWVPVTSQRVCIDWGASAAGTTLTLQLRCCGWIENADT